MIYRVHYNDDADGSAGFAYFTVKREAENAARAWHNESPETRLVEIEAEKTPKTRKAVVNLLRLWGSHSDNG